MKIVLASGIYPPDIGGPATYVFHLAKELKQAGHQISVLTYGENMEDGKWKMEWPVIHVSKRLPIIRWFRYARALKRIAEDADIVYAFSSISCGIPVWLARLSKPKKVLRLGGDFFWERYTDHGGKKTLREWYETRYSLLVTRFIQWVLNTLDYIIFSTRFQEKIYEKAYKKLPSHSVIENAFAGFRPPEEHPMRSGNLRILFMGRFVGFKNLHALINAMQDLPNVLLTMVGEGPLKSSLMEAAERFGVSDQVAFVSPVDGDAKTEIFDLHDLLILPSLTEISPNVALEARMAGLPVLLTEETGLSAEQTKAMTLRKLRTPKEIVDAIEDFERPAFDSSLHIDERSWKAVAEEHLSIFSSLQ